MNQYCTYFDQGYLAQGVAMWHSLTRHDRSAVLSVLALDSATAGVLRGFNDNRLRVIERGELLEADAELAAVEFTRSRTEFIFALTPCLVRHIFARDAAVDAVIYLDADLFFFGDATALWNEFGRGSVLIVPHRFPSWHDDSARYGQFNVGVVGFRRDSRAQACVAWWREQCLHSTSVAANGMRYGDQKYLDQWPSRFAAVVESRHPGINVAPWNWASHRFTWDAAHVHVDDQPLLVYHFAQFKRVTKTCFDSGQLEYGVMPRRLRSRIYGAYWAGLSAAENDIRTVHPGFSIACRGWASSLGQWHLALLRVFWGQFWWKAGGSWLAIGSGFGTWSGRAMGVYRRWQRGSS